MSRIKSRLPEIVLVLSVVILFHRLLLGEVLFWGTPSLQFYPWREFAFGELRRGRLPVWNPLVGNGAPLIANYQSAIFYPPNWLNLVLPTAHLMGWLGMLHLIWAGLGMMAYLRRLGVDRFGQGVGALAYALSGYLVSRFGFLSIVAAAPWLPWLLWALDGLWDTDGVELRRRVVLLAVIVGLQLLAGHAQTTFYSLVFAGFYAAFRSIQRRTPIKLLPAFSGVALGIGLAAIQLLPTLELLQTSQRRTGFDRVLALTYSYWPWRPLTWIAPNVFGSPATGDYWAYGAYWEDATFVGLLTTFLAAYSLLRWVRAPRDDAPGHAVIPFFALSFPPVLLLALGQNTPVFPWLFDHVPTFDLFQAPARWMLLAVFAMAALGGIGAHQWAVSERLLFWTRLAIAGGVSTIAVAWFARSYISSIEPTIIRATFRLGISVIVLGALFLLQPEPGTRLRPVWQGAALTLLAVDLVAAGWGLNPTIDPAFYRAQSPLADDLDGAIDDSRTLYLPQDEYTAKFETFLDVGDFRPDSLQAWLPLRESLLPNLGMLDGLPTANNFDPLRIGPHDTLVESTRDAALDEVLPRLRAMNVGALIATHPLGDLQPIASADSVTAYALPNTLPRVYLVGEAWEAADTNEAIALMSQESFDPAQVVILETTLSATQSRNMAGSAATVLRQNPTTITIDVQATTSGWLILTDAWYPGWRATLDGQRATVHRANAAFRAVAVPQGHHTIVFDYVSRSLMWGAIVTVLATGLAVYIARWGTRDG